MWQIEKLSMNFVFDKPTKCNIHLIRVFYVNWDPQNLDFEVQIRGKVVKFEAHYLSAILGTLEADSIQLRQLNIMPPYPAIRHMLGGNRLTARWSRHKDNNYYFIFSYAYMNREARVWLKIVCHCLMSGKHIRMLLMI